MGHARVGWGRVGQCKGGWGGVRWYAYARVG